MLVLGTLSSRHILFQVIGQNQVWQCRMATTATIIKQYFDNVISTLSPPKKDGNYSENVLFPFLPSFFSLQSHQIILNNVSALYILMIECKTIVMGMECIFVQSYVSNLGAFRLYALNSKILSKLCLN